MSAPRDPWADFVQAIAEFIPAHTPITDDELDAMADQYQRQQIAGASSDTGPVDAAGTWLGHH